MKEYEVSLRTILLNSLDNWTDKNYLKFQKVVYNSSFNLLVTDFKNKDKNFWLTSLIQMNSNLEYLRKFVVNEELDINEVLKEYHFYKNVYKSIQG